MTILFVLFLHSSYQDSHSQGWCTNASCWSWVGFRLDTVCVLFMISVAAGAFYVKLDAGKFEFKLPRKVLICIVYLPIKMLHATLKCARRCEILFYFNVISSNHVTSLFSAKLRHSVAQLSAMQFPVLWLHSVYPNRQIREFGFCSPFSSKFSF